MSFARRISTALTPEEALRHRYAQVKANIAMDAEQLLRLREKTELRTALDKKRYRRIQERQQRELYKRDEIAKIASMCEIRLSP